MSCEKDEIKRNINELSFKYTQNTEKILLLSKQQIKTSTELTNAITSITEVKNLCFYIIGVLFTLLMTVIGGLIFIIYEFGKYLPMVEYIFEKG